MIHTNVIEQVKRVSIPVYLQSKGILPASKQEGKNAYSYRSPLSGEKTPSFFVSKDETAFNDYSTGEKGDVIRLVRLLERLDFISAIKRLKTFVNAPAGPLELDTVENPTIIETAFDKTTITGIRTLQNPDLIKYVEQVRGIPFEYASPYLSQIHYNRTDKRTNQLKRYFGAGFRTDAGTWAIRTNGFKSWLGPGTITTLPVTGSRSINLFEGCFSFLSACVYFGRVRSHNTTIVLNSVTHLSRALPVLQKAETVFTYLDNDRAGRNALQRLQNEGVNVVNRANTYAKYNDFNDYLISLS